MRLFSKVREGTAFDVGSDNSKFQSVQPVVRQQLKSDTAEQQQASTQSISACMDVLCVYDSSAIYHAPLFLSVFWQGTSPCAMSWLACFAGTLKDFVLMQIQQQAAQVAINAAKILAQAERLKQAAAPDTAQLWTDGSLGENEGLPPRKTRIYISSSAAVTDNSSSAPSTAKFTDGGQPSKKKRKGKAERNRVKRQAALASSIT